MSQSNMYQMPITSYGQYHNIGSRPPYTDGGIASSTGGPIVERNFDCGGSQTAHQAPMIRDPSICTPPVGAYSSNSGQSIPTEFSRNVSSATVSPASRCDGGPPSSAVTTTANTGTKQTPSTAPSFPDAESLNQALPPKRELPFARRENKSGGAKRSVTQSSKLPVPPNASSTSSNAHAKGSGKSTPLNQKALSNRKSKINGSTHECSSKPSGDTLHNEAPAEMPQKGLDSHDPGTRGMHHNHNGSSSSSSSNKAGTVSTTTTSFIPNTSSETGESSPLTQEASGGKSITFITSEDLSTYIATPTTERSALIESWVCQQLESDAFTTLCQDVEGVWRRIAFGQ